MQSPVHPTHTRRDHGFALVLVLAFVVLLVGVCLAFFSNSILQRQISNSSATQVQVDLLAQGAVDLTIADLQSEIAAGSTARAISPVPAFGSKNIYDPSTTATMVPAPQGVTPGSAGLENIIKISSAAPFYTGSGFSSNGPVRGSNISTSTPPPNGRSIDAKRWNKPMFVTPKSITDTTPNGVTFPDPNWIYIAKDGTTTTASENIRGRYAYVIYDEGGLLDINVAGYPDALSPNTGGIMNRKIGMPYVNLAKLIDLADNPVFTQAQAKTITSWRDYATNLSVEAAADKQKAYAQFVFTNSNGFLQAANTKLENLQSDAKFCSRQQFINFAINKLNAVNALPYLTTFSRDLNQPSFIPEINRPMILSANSGGNSEYQLDNKVNPSFLATRVTNSFMRNDQTRALPGDPLIKKRFALEKLAWLTYKGPSHDRSQTDKDIQRVMDNGIPWSYLQQGTGDNIKKYFGLEWTGSEWKYDVHNGTGSGPSGAILRLSDIPTSQNPHEPDFFELLKSAIHVGSLGKAGTTPGINDLIQRNNPGTSFIPPVYRYYLDSSVDSQIIQIGANIIDQADADGFPTKITFDDGDKVGPHEYLGVESLPYLNNVFNGVVQISNTAGVWIEIPAVWNPCDPNGSYGAIRPSDFRVVADSTTPDNIGKSSYTTIQAYTASDTNSAVASPVTSALQLNESNSVISFKDTSKDIADGGTALTQSFQDPTCLIDTTANGVSGQTFTSSVAEAMPGRSSSIFVGIKLGDLLIGTPYNVAVLRSNTGSNRFYITYRVQYKDPNSSQWITYDTKYGRPATGWHYYNYQKFRSVIMGADDSNKGFSWASAIDPRTSRFGFLTGLGMIGVDSYATFPPPLANFHGGPTMAPASIDVKGKIFSQMPDRQSGFILNSAAQGHATNPSQPYNLRDVLFPGADPENSLQTKNTYGWAITSIEWFGNAPPIVPIGLFSLNNTAILYREGRFSGDSWGHSARMGLATNPIYYTDPDGMVRRAMGAYVPPDTGGGTAPQGSAKNTAGVSPARISPFSGFSAITPSFPPINPTGSYNQAQSRPLMLNRPLRSVAELGYVFRDMPWKNLDFFTPESGDSALLDVFCINDTNSPSDLVAGKVNLNTTHANILKTILADAYMDDPKISDANVGALSTTVSNLIADAFIKRRGSKGCIKNIAELIGKLQNPTAISYPSGSGSYPATSVPPLTGSYKDGRLSYDGFSGSFPTSSAGVDLSGAFNSITDANLKSSLNQIQRLHEAPIRALASMGQTRVWNLMIDVIAQTGRLPKDSSDLGKFSVDGESRFWVHLAIDRFTGNVVDRYVESVNE